MKENAPYANARADEKHRDREEDRLAVERGLKSKEQLRQENGHFAVDAQIDLASSSF